MSAARSAVVIGSGIFGVTTALELRRRGWVVTLTDPGPLPHPDAASTDVSKAIRMDYGSDEHYMEMMEEAFAGWDAWNARWLEPLYHEVGFLVMAAGPMRPGGFEHDSFEMLKKRGHRPERLDAAGLRARFPAWGTDVYRAGYFNPRAGWAESAKVVAWLVEEARGAGVVLREGLRAVRLVESGSRVAGVELVHSATPSASTPQETIRADVVVAAAGPWSPALLPHLRDFMDVVGQPVVHFLPRDPEPFRAPRFSVWTADIAHSGWYGFPALPNGIVKIGNHGPGRALHPDDPRRVTESELAHVRAFASATFPGLADAPIAASRLCLYADTWDGDFYIDHDPERPGLFVATGGSGHAFKFAPILGRVAADTVEGKPNRYASRFAWRRRGHGKKEQARFKE